MQGDAGIVTPDDAPAAAALEAGMSALGRRDYARLIPPGAP